MSVDLLDPVGVDQLDGGRVDGGLELGSRSRPMDPCRGEVPIERRRGVRRSPRGAAGQERDGMQLDRVLDPLELGLDQLVDLRLHLLESRDVDEHRAGTAVTPRFANGDRHDEGADRLDEAVRQIRNVLMGLVLQGEERRRHRQFDESGSVDLLLGAEVGGDSRRSWRGRRWSGCSPAGRGRRRAAPASSRGR